MQIQVKLSLEGNVIKQDTIVIEEQRLGDLSDEEIERAIEVRIRTWVDRLIQVEWEELEES
jgi:hypothetical protein